MIEVFRLVRNVLADDGTLWLNLGDSYASAASGGGGQSNCVATDGKKCDEFRNARYLNQTSQRTAVSGIKLKDLCGIPWRCALALQADGWYLRCDIIWHKPNPMPESVTDRPTRGHEYMFLFSKKANYYYDAIAIKEPTVGQNLHDLTGQGYSVPGQSPQEGNRRRSGNKERVYGGGLGQRPDDHLASGVPWEAHNGRRNKRSVWTIPSEPFSDAHFATFPSKLVEPCILAGSRPGDIVLDPFFGSGTTGAVAEHLGRDWIGVDLNDNYSAMQAKRTAQMGMVLA